MLISHRLVRPNLLQLHSPGVKFFVLRTDDRLAVVDSGFIGGRAHLFHALEKVGWAKLPITNILVTHGHLDHILNVGRLAKKTGAKIWAPPEDEAHYQGRPDYSGFAHVTGLLEKLGRPALGFKTFSPDRPLTDGLELDLWGGLCVISLPGHTRGHCGFYSEKHRLLFSADLFASYPKLSHRPPAFFNHDSAENKTSIAKALALDLTGVLPNHGDRAAPEVHLRRLRKLQTRWT